jgi:hypothetical protein
MIDFTIEVDLGEAFLFAKYNNKELSISPSIITCFLETILNNNYY